MISVLDFFNRVRTLLELNELPCAWMSGTEQDDETNCIVATALGAPVGESEHPDWSADSRWVMRPPDRAAGRCRRRSRLAC